MKILCKYNWNKFIFTLLIFTLGWISNDSFHYFYPEKDNFSFIRGDEYIPINHMENILQQMRIEQEYAEKERQKDIDSGIEPMSYSYYISKYRHLKEPDLYERR